jgi:protein-S-isoprenylcysteine O-methyltransferase Ste14
MPSRAIAPPYREGVLAAADRGECKAPPLPHRLLVSLLGPMLHAALLLAPLVVAGRLPRALGDAAILLFLLLAHGFFLCDAPTLARPRGLVGLRPSGEAVLARRWALATGLLLLATFWACLLERARGREGAAPLGWPQASGASLMLAGISLRAAAVRTLGRRFVTELSPDEAAPSLVEHGVYARVRHPSEAGNLGVVLGAAVLLESRSGLALALGGVLPVVLGRIRLEDRHLARVFPERYRRYAGRVRSLIPFVY